MGDILPIIIKKAPNDYTLKKVITIRGQLM